MAIHARIRNAALALAATGALAFGPAQANAQATGPTTLSLAGTDLKFYGFLRMDTIVSDSALNHQQYSMWVNSEPEGKEDKGYIDMYPRLTRFGFTLHRDSLPRLETSKLDGTLEIDFQNRAVDEVSGGSESRETPRLRQAFFKLGLGPAYIIGGQAWDLIAPLWPIVNADAGMWNSGNLGDRRPQLRVGLDRPIGEAKLQAALALARTGAVDLKDLDGNKVRDGDDSGRPMIQGRLGVAGLLGKIDLGVWGHNALETTEAAVGPEGAGNKTFTSSSVGADLSAKAGKLTLAGEFFSGKNLSDLRGGVGQGVSKKSGEEIKATGGWANARVAALPWLSLGAGAGLDKADKDDLSDGDREKNLALFGNLEADAGGGFVFGLDYINWKTEYVGKPKGTANRFDLYGMFKF